MENRAYTAYNCVKKSSISWRLLKGWLPFKAEASRYSIVKHSHALASIASSKRNQQKTMLVHEKQWKIGWWWPFNGRPFLLRYAHGGGVSYAVRSSQREVKKFGAGHKSLRDFFLLKYEYICVIIFIALPNTSVAFQLFAKDTSWFIARIPHSISAIIQYDRVS